ncbi:MAG: hypothetical protein CML68_25315 [Rhodobacteraceae bacterium]|nr:hypothetical protein [Paracoccaceae bacterium]MBB97907.1 hypothetical protein [Paracoccaceae bacterium]
MLSWITKAVPLAFAAAMVLGTPSAEAATFVSTGTCTAGTGSDVTASGGNADACFGAARTLVRRGDLNTSTYAESWRSAKETDPGLFGYTDYSFWGSANRGGPNSVELTSNRSRTEGTWSVDAGAFDSVLRIVVILTTATKSTAYLFENPAEITGGTWSTAAFAGVLLGGKPLTDVVIYTSGLAPIPVPAGAVLLLSGVGAFGFMSRRKKRREADAAAEPAAA